MKNSCASITDSASIVNRSIRSLSSNNMLGFRIPQPTAASTVLIVLLSLLPTALADGIGLIGWGKHMYQPACAFACRNIVRACPLLCTPKPGGKNYGTVHSPNWTPPECFTTDQAFMRTMALCIDNYCPISDRPTMYMLQDYWASHLAVTTVGNYQWVPSMSLAEAVNSARAEEKAKEDSMGNNSTGHAGGSDNGGGSHSAHSRLKARQHHGASSESGNSTQRFTSALPTIKARAPLNVTSFILWEDWQRAYNGATLFETNEVGHSNATIAVLFTALFIPVLFSMLRFIPGLSRSRTWTWINCIINHPAAFGSHHRQPVAAAIGGVIVPTRGQVLYIALISLLNFILLVAPYYYVYPNSTYPIRRNQDLATIGNRAGSMAMGNAAALFLFSARNNVLLWLTDWSHGTFLLLHRWLGVWTILLTVVHSCLLLATYVEYGDYAMELARLYWHWGIVGTVAAVALWPTSILALRRAAYELFLPLHQLLAILFLVGYYYHIWYLYQYQWGYEIWVWIAVGFWGLERVLRLGRMAVKGLRTAQISAVEGSKGEYLRIDIDGVRSGGVVYLCFPTLSWMFWENHPFSVLSSEATDVTATEKPEATEKTSALSEKTCPPTEKPTAGVVSMPSPSSPSHNTLVAPTSTNKTPSHPRTTIIVRTRTGVTARLAARLANAASTSSTPLRLPVLIEGSYRYSSSAEQRLRGCTSVLCIAGGVGVTAVLPLLLLLLLHSKTAASSASTRGRLVWGVRDGSLPAALAPELASLQTAGFEVETSVGKRVDVAAVLEQELLAGGGLLGVVVCGPPGMADEVRARVAQLGRSGRRAVVFVDEAFSW
ncbi:hypothetical protein PgNI_11403 [Pyricularia grisea]|uniref:Ferric oxidoreductase domain-containing protein n=1 Tax=Pyricularia grisea TaxID=148305 RepID=A0A6P8APK7_PYRGI|nr:hypothetical protein PgNI_11403 [Pyricularia grisea]TLD03965.1 hypothetical protein PgNI_11403 [Pyricularia grisea]